MAEMRQGPVQTNSEVSGLSPGGSVPTFESTIFELRLRVRPPLTVDSENKSVNDYPQQQENTKKRRIRIKKKNNIISDQVRSAIKKKFEEGSDFVQLAQDLGVARTTAYSIVKSGREMKQPMGGKRIKLMKVTDDLKLRLLELLESNPSITLADLKKSTGNVVSTSTIDRVLDGALITTKLLHVVPFGKNSEENIVKRQAFCVYYQGETKRKCHIDETNFNLFTRRNIGRAKKGHRARLPQRNCKGRNINLIIAIDDFGSLVHKELHIGSIKDNFKDFIATLLQKLGDDPTVIFMDNAPIHQKLENFVAVNESAHSI